MDDFLVALFYESIYYIFLLPNLVLHNVSSIERR